MTATAAAAAPAKALDAPLTFDSAEKLIRLLTDGLVSIEESKGEFMTKIANGPGFIDQKGWRAWEWTQGIAISALWKHYSLSPESNVHSLNTLLDWFRYQYKATDGKGTSKNINTMAPFYGLACAVEAGAVPEDEKEQWIGWLDEWAEWIMNDLPRTEQGGFQHITFKSDHVQNIWDDTLMMTIIPLVKIGRLLNRPHYIDEAIFQIMLHIEYLMEPKTGLWYHGWEFTPEKGPLQKGHNFVDALWARGNAWITLSLPIFLSITELPPTDPTYRILVSTLQRQVDALVATQDPETGLWHTLLVDPTSYVETSASAGFAAGIMMALSQGILEGEQYLACAKKAVDGIVAQIRPNGEVDNVSFGTGADCESLQHYKDIPITPMPYGQALAMWTIVEWEKLQATSA